MRALRDALDQGLRDADAVGHRIVHGGERFPAATLIDPEVEAALHELVNLAPLHQPKSLAALDAVSAALPDLPAFACFDTAFHATLRPRLARTLCLRRGESRPTPLRLSWALPRLGGAACPRTARRTAAELRIVSCHLGAGASLCAIADGRSIDTTMGFTPLEGLVMATRSGSVDPGLLLWLLERGDTRLRSSRRRSSTSRACSAWPARRICAR